MKLNQMESYIKPQIWSVERTKHQYDLKDPCILLECNSFAFWRRKAAAGVELGGLLTQLAAGSMLV